MPERVLKLFRNVDGRRVAVEFVIDAEDTIVSEKAETVIPKNEREQRLDRLGYTYEKTAGGGIMITVVPKREQQISRFFIPDSPCFFPGCEALRAQYLAESARLGKDCPSCEKGALMNKYRDKVSDLL